MKQFLKEVGPFALCVVVFVAMAAMPSAEVEDLGTYIDHPVEDAMYGQDQVQKELHEKLGLL
jgi:hypothetical protein